MNSDTNDETGFANQTVWLRGFQMIVVALMMWVAGWVLDGAGEWRLREARDRNTKGS